MKAVLALIVIYVGTFLVAIQGASNSPVEASEQTSPQTMPAPDPVKEKEIRSLLELTGAREEIQDAANNATELYRERVRETSADNDRAQALTNAYLAQFQKKFDADTLNSQLVGIYDQHFSEEEIKGLLEFYGSPLGQKVAEEMPKIGRELRQATRNTSSQAARLAWQNLRAENSPQPATGGENVRELGARRRRGLPANPSEPLATRPAVNQQISADSQQP